jgi:predicted O-methyltransferase YrrM
MDLLPSTFRGTAYRLANVWFSYIPQKNQPIRYLEIGAYYGANILSVAASYAKHPDSVLVAVDPWTDYSEYPEYKGQQETIYDTFQSNVKTSEHSNKIVVKRGYSHEVIPTLEDSSFDIIYIDGNHEPEYVLEDAVIAFRKLKVGGYMIFDDYGWVSPDLTQRGIDSFLKGYYKRIQTLGMRESQVFIQKTR